MTMPRSLPPAEAASPKRALRIVKRLSFGVLMLATLAAAALVVEFAFRRPYTPSIKATADTRPIAALGTWRIRGTRQSVLLRGHDRSKPILLFLHGGPGMPVMFMAHAFQRKLEQDFVVVHWDRRGAGKSYDAGVGNAPSVSDTLQDLYALTEALRDRLGQAPIYLVGHSWGTYLGMLAAHERPDLFAAYVGTGQMAADADRIRAARNIFFLEEARRRRDAEMIRRLRSGDELTEDDLFRYGAELRGAESFWPILVLGLRAPEYTLGDVMNVPKGSSQLLKTMRYDVIRGPLDRNLLEFKIPVYFLLGRHDWNEPSVLAAAYLQRIRAPRKGLLWFENAAHFPFLEEPDRFHRAMLSIDHAVTSIRGK